MHCLPGREAVAHVEESRGCEGARGRSAATNWIIVAVVGRDKDEIDNNDDGEGGGGGHKAQYYSTTGKLILSIK